MTIVKFEDSSTTHEVIARIQKDCAGLDVDDDGITLNWVYEYWIDWPRLAKPMDLVSWLHRLSQKGWFTPFRQKLFIEAVCEYRGWELYK